MIKIAPSILSADFSDLRSALNLCDVGMADYIHIDVMDNHFVPNLSIGPPVVKSIRLFSKSYFDVHLMVTNPREILDSFAKAGADGITFHIEAVDNPGSLIDQIKSLELEVGISLKPATPLEEVIPFLDQIDRVLIMSVNPGFGGQKFIESSLDKIRQLNRALVQYRLKNKVEIEVDGGIKLDNAQDVISAGADTLVVGSGIFKAQDPLKQLSVFKLLQKH
ncbi:MAG: ribulose-phosphate 3-epimerase [Candidatus Marinimicrobia bacterium]|nr:ribulose-phosphate 3-epimerase [Candidatus Neomarinimicrobiota bacterium]